MRRPSIEAGIFSYHELNHDDHEEHEEPIDGFRVLRGFVVTSWLPEGC
jgi:hypothetical protein